MKRRTTSFLSFAIKLLLFVALCVGTTDASTRHPRTARAAGVALDPHLQNFSQAAPQGFGDRQNGWAWSMQWWRDHLYVGTNRAWHCAEVAALNRSLPSLFPYPPADPDVQCTQDPADLDLHAEIWRWSRLTGLWQRVFQSPNDVPIPERSGKFVARDVGFRGMAVFTEPDGTEALYVTGVSASFLWMGASPPRILRSTDGVQFQPIPQDPGTVLGDVSYSSFRNPIVFQDRFYVVGGLVQGSGELLEAENPAGGNNNFRIISSGEMIVSAVEAFHDFLYVGVRDSTNGYAVVKTDMLGPSPFHYTTVVDQGGFTNPPDRNTEILDMKVFKDHLYVGGNGIKAGVTGLGGPAELIRISPDGSWDLIVGSPRQTPEGMKYPLSGFESGFNNLYNGHMWRLEVFEDNLYVGTFDSSTTLKDDPTIGPSVEYLMGFDLYRTPNGSDFFRITTTGFGDRFNFGVRSLQATPYGLFLGSANYYYGLQIWRSGLVQAHLPMITTGP